MKKMKLVVEFFHWKCFALVWAPFAVFAISSLGCGNGYSTAKVQGQVSMLGKPIGPGTVMFIPEKTAAVRFPIAALRFGDDGKFAGMVTVAKCQVMIVSGDEESTDEGYRGRTAIPKKYGDPINNGLSAEITDGDNECIFNLSPS